MVKMLAEWLSAQDTGLVGLDNDAKPIDVLIREVFVLLEREENAIMVARRLRELLFLLDHQFNTERSLMQISFYPNHDRHHNEHKKLLAEFETILNISGFSRCCLRQVASFVRDCLTQHRETADLHLETFLRTTPETVRQAYCRKALEIAVLDRHLTPA